MPATSAGMTICDCAMPETFDRFHRTGHSRIKSVHDGWRIATVSADLCLNPVPETVAAGQQPALIFCERCRERAIEEDLNVSCHQGWPASEHARRAARALVWRNGKRSRPWKPATEMEAGDGNGGTDAYERQL